MAVGVSIFFLLALPTIAGAVCAAPPKGGKRDFYRESLKEADAAITGRVLRTRVVEVEHEGSPAVSHEYLTVLRIGRAYKGKQRLPITRVRVWSSGSTGLIPKVGSRKGLFLYRHRGRWTSSICDVLSRKTLRRIAT